MDSSQRRRAVTPAQQVNPGTNAAQVSTTAPGTLRDLRKSRHGGLFEAMHRLDMALDDTSRQELADWIRGQYVTEYGDIPLGFVAVCYLGAPYVDHRLDLVHTILDHFTATDAMPEPFAQARMLARTGAYAFVEIHSNGKIIPVLPDGSVVA